MFWTAVERSVLLTVVDGRRVDADRRRHRAADAASPGLGAGGSSRCRLVVAWSVPSVVSTEMFAWMTDYNYGVVNWLLGMPRHNWYINNVEGFGVAGAVVVWGAVPLITISTYAALSQVPSELVEAARVDGATSGTDPPAHHAAADPAHHPAADGAVDHLGPAGVRADLGAAPEQSRPRTTSPSGSTPTPRPTTATRTAMHPRSRSSSCCCSPTVVGVYMRSLSKLGGVE